MSKAEKYFIEWSKQFEEDGVPFSSFSEHSSAFAESYAKHLIESTDKKIKRDSYHSSVGGCMEYLRDWKQQLLNKSNN